MDVQDTSGEAGQVEQVVEKDMGAAEVVDQDQTGTEGQEQQQTEASEEAGNPERGTDGKFKPKAGVQSRIDELTRARHEADREAAYWRGLAQQQSAQSSAQAAPTKPTVDQYDDYGEYVEALTDWKADQAVAKRMAADSDRKVGEVRVQTFQERQTEFAKATPDYVEVMRNSTAPIAPHVIEAVQESDVGPELLYHFVKNPDVLDRINHMDERQANREMGRLEATLGTSKASAAPAPATKKVTQAPAPAGTTKTQGRSTVPDLANASMDEYMAQRKSQGARWAR